MEGYERPRINGDDVEHVNTGAASKNRDDEFWFDDGSVVLALGDIEFCVYKGVLSDYSPVFRDMFSLPKPTSPSDTIGEAPTELTADSCPVVHLSDRPGDLKHSLRMCIPKSGSM